MQEAQQKQRVCVAEWKSCLGGCDGERWAAAELSSFAANVSGSPAPLHVTTDLTFAGGPRFAVGHAAATAPKVPPHRAEHVRASIPNTRWRGAKNPGGRGEGKKQYLRRPQTRIRKK